MPEIQEYGKGHTICLNPEEKWKFAFGVNKAKMIVENIDAIKKFYEEYGHELKENKKSNSKVEVIKS